MLNTRGSGVLLHISSLPSPYGIGDLGPSAYRFVDLLVSAGQRYWQVLPTNPTGTIFGNSPYCSYSAFANNTLFLSPELMAQDGLLDRAECANPPPFPDNRVDYPAVTGYKEHLFHLAYNRFKERPEKKAYDRFCGEQAYWLEDFALFIALKEHFGGQVWSDWPEEFRDRLPEALDRMRAALSERIGLIRFLQFEYYRQWTSLHNYARERSVHLIGDIPIYVTYDSADVWTNPAIFKLGENKKPLTVAGVPPDFFSNVGQRWGNPVYRWDELQKRQYQWLVARFAYIFSTFDLVRIDHFRGFVAFWEVPEYEKDAVHGWWTQAPAIDLFSYMQKKFLFLPVVAEDLGIINAEVREVVQRFGFPGTRVLLFAFVGVPDNPHIPHNHIRNCLLYTGTHDNNTVRGWFETEAMPAEKERVRRYLGRDVPPHEIHQEFIRLAMSSIADTVILPLQDILGLGAEARMNRPATSEGNWEWRVAPDRLTGTVAEQLRTITMTYERG